MKTLYLLRHAKSSWDEPGLADFDRPLNERGLRTAPFMGEVIKNNNLPVDLILSSPARRASQTAQMVKAAGGLPAEIQFEDGIYEASPLRLIQIVSDLDDRFDSVMLVGHNPGFEDLVRFLSGSLHPMPTAALAVIDLEHRSWRDLHPDFCSLRLLIRPKEEMTTKVF